jgi:cytochrome P450
VGRAVKERLPPGPRLGRPLQTWLLWRWPLEVLEECRRRYGNTFTLRSTSRPPLIFLADHSAVKRMFRAPPNILCPGEGGEMIAPIVGKRSFMLLDGAEHFAGRMTVAPEFHARAVHCHAERVATLAAREIATWRSGLPLALHLRLRALTLDIILRSSLKLGPCSTEERLRELHRRLLAMLTVTESAAFPEPLLRHGPGAQTWRCFLRQRASVDELLHSIIADRTRSGQPCDDLLDRLLRAHNVDGSPFSSRQIRDNLMSVILAGHETTAAQLAWAFQLLAHNPGVQERLIEELDADKGAAYLSATIKEVLRHRPVFLFAIPRAVKIPIEIGAFSFRPPAQLLACIYLLHHDPAVYPEPDEFRPERFLQAPSQVWLPWGGGRKRCPGLHLATLELETVLRTTLATMTIRPAAPTIERPRWRSVIVTPHAGCRVVLHPRHGRPTAATRH